MRGCCEVPRQGGKAAVGAGSPCDVNVGRPRPAGRSPAPLRSVICQGAKGWYSARPALIYTSPALPLSLLGPGKRVVTFAVNNEFWQVPLISPLFQFPPWFPGGAGRLQGPWARGHRGAWSPRLPSLSRVFSTRTRAAPEHPKSSVSTRDGLGVLLCAPLPSPGGVFCGSNQTSVTAAPLLAV